MERSGDSAIVRPAGDLVIATARNLYGCLRALARRRGLRSVVVDLSGTGRLDSAGVATISLGLRMMKDRGKEFELRDPSEHHRAALDLLPASEESREEAPAPPGRLERIGEGLYGLVDKLAGVADLLVDTSREAMTVAARRRRLPAGSLLEHAATMGVDALPIIGLLSFLLGVTLAFQASVQLERFGADVFVADLVGVAVVREFGPLMTAIILTGRSGAAIAAELGSMRVREEVDALRVMGVSPIRFLVLPRLAALTAVGPALTLMAMFIGLAGGMLIAATVMDLAPATFLARVAQRVTLGDIGHGLLKSLVFAWIVGFTGVYMGLRAVGGASSVGLAATRAVVASLFLIIVVDSAFATIATLTRAR